MNKKLNKKKLLIVSVMGTIALFAIIATFNIGFGSSKEDGKLRDTNLSSVTMTNLMDFSSKEIYKGPSENSGKVAYITIDDGSSKYTDDIIKILNKYNAKATFFMIDGNIS